MIIGIDASNIRGGGGVTHLVELLRAADPKAHEFSQIILWSGQCTLNKIEDRSWLVKMHSRSLEKDLFHRTLWQRFQLSNMARSAGCDVLFVPGGAFGGDFEPMVTMNRNLLPFEGRELWRYGLSWMTLKMLLLRRAQSRTLRKADGVIFLTRHAKNIVNDVVRVNPGKSTTIPHGVNKRFVMAPREQLAIDNYTLDRPFRILYISTVDRYKHQWQVAKAVAQLRESGLPVALDLVGPSHSFALMKLHETMAEVDPKGKYISYLGALTYETVHTHYVNADLKVFASSCEAFAQILLEAMSAGLPIACSNLSSMWELLGDAGQYFDPENPDDIAKAIRQMIESPELRAQKAKMAFSRAQEYTWQRCANETFGILKKVTKKNCNVSDSKHNAS